ncbi:baseplate protein [Streptococcus phage Javan629]|uniref:phage tail assembly chaperone G n=1 Tax=Streptococcus uberis TaxID=1349 RepID=UPI000620492C|nr:hypothetical protein [Streptococcus uberis]KKF47133.1 hypothetical protein AF62_08145 [Streptococcus uberis C8329]QBX22017.1 baseplate protein [Streptococcus phage Javan629]
MALIEVKVRNDRGEKVVYSNGFLPVRKYREYLELQAKKEEGNLNESQALELELEFIASLFEGLTIDKMYDGLTMAELNELIVKVFTELVGGDVDDPKDEN